MRVFVLGATGRVGRQVSRRLTALAGVSSVVVASRDIGRAQGVAAELGCEAAAVVAGDEERLTELLTGCDLLVNTSGPDTEVLLPALRSAIRSGTGYCDIAADGPTVERALDLHQDAVSAGVTAVLGIGGAPGFTNLLCRHAAAQLDGVDELNVGYVWECPQPAASAVAAAEMRRSGRVDASWQTLFTYVCAPVRVVREARLVTVNPWDNPRTIDLPDSGAFTGFPVNSSEPVTLLRSLPGIRDMVSLVGMFPPKANDLWKELAAGVTSGTATAADAVVELHSAIAADAATWEHSPDAVPPVAIGVNAIGHRAGRRVVYSARPTEWWALTNVILTAGCGRILSGGLPPGVFAPEAVFDPLPFFAAAAGIWGGALPEGRLLVEAVSPLAG